MRHACCSETISGSEMKFGVEAEVFISLNSRGKILERTLIEKKMLEGMHTMSCALS